MKNIKLIIASFFLIAFLGCEEDERSTQFLDNVDAPSELAMQFSIVQDNSGLVTITPNAVGATQFEVFFGDGSNQSVDLEVGQSVDNVYAEGTYTVSVTATSINGLMTQADQQLMVSFRTPENLAITADIDASNVFKLNVSATADYAASFLVYFDTSDPDELPTPMALGETVSNIYPLVGDYTIKVEALSGGIETLEGLQTITVSAPTELPIDFEAFDSTTFVGFGGASGAIIANPDTGGNPSATVARIVKDGPQVWAGNVIEVSEPIDFSVQKLITLNVWSPRPSGTMLMKLENISDAGIFIEKTVTLSGNSAWEEVSVDFSDIDTTQEFQKIVLFFDFGTVGDGSADWTFYIDDITQAFAGVTTTEMLQDFEGAQPTFTTFGNIADIEVIANPDQTGVNTTNTVAKLTKSAGSEVWAGSFFETPAPFDLAAYGKINVKTWSPVIGAQVKLKLENADASITTEIDLNTTVANQWEDLLYDFSTAPIADYTRIVIFFDFGNAGDDSVYYYDEIELVNENGASSLEFQDFEGDVPTFTVFGNIADVEVIANPDATGANTTTNVARLTKTSGSEVWAGSFYEVDTALDLTAYANISVKTWSPIAGAQVKLKLENADASITHEVDLNSTVAGAWETLVYDFSAAPTADYVRVVIFFDFGNPGDDSDYYYDEFELTN
ncbi:hypothetical protein [Winogradskyella sp. UBA3174]|uniref:hypothetical protein n=1 Tax=Winogradskyella sp. UBA3174 TaxID=1947785 RepID=UPI0025D5EEC5|nr:hypothetical protein [Winogradskyella sp. UBA3174]|tara:strand:+ start:8142 stop:10160 length:2019 start_codon:yes stop_codon:yes gene_type:complete